MNYFRSLYSAETTEPEKLLAMVGLEEKLFPLDGLADNMDFQDTLRLGPIETIHSQETTLEQVFIQVTGR